jgi:hypothetical protein
LALPGVLINAKLDVGKEGGHRHPADRLKAIGNLGQGGSKRDFVDLACFLRKFANVTLGEVLELLQRKYGSMNRAHLLRALTYFADAASDPMPRMRWSLKCDEVERQLEEAVKDLFR